MTRTLRLALAAGTLLTVLIGANPVTAGGGATYGACVAHHATNERGFSGDHNPAMHRGFAGWTESCAHA